MPKLPYANIERGTLLIASPDLDQGIFSRSVILLCDDTRAGSFGVIINKPLELEFSEDMGVCFDECCVKNIRLCMGGPIQGNQMMILHSNACIENSLEICHEVFLGGNINFFQGSLGLEESFSLISLCFGFVSWESGQLEQEFFDGLWFLYKASKEYVFFDPLEDLWKTVLLNMGGKYASLSSIPEDLSLN